MLTGKNKVVLFDLDHTLYEAFRCRKTHLKHIFKKHFDLAQFPWSIYFAIREKHKVFDLIYNRSFHQHWLSPQLAALLTGIINGDLSPNRMITLLNRLENKVGLISQRYIRSGAFILKASEILREDLEF